jgi:hypothetical protein
MSDRPRRTRPPTLDADDYQPPVIEPPKPNFNARLALRITEMVGTMWCAYAFAILALISLPAAIKSGSTVQVVSWFSQTFLQLVLLAVIIVGQNVQAKAAEERSQATYEDANTVLFYVLKVQEHLQAQDELLIKTREFQETLDQGEVVARLRDQAEVIEQLRARLSQE